MDYLFDILGRFTPVTRSARIFLVRSPRVIAEAR
jgi:hypothetical protein